VAILAVLIVPVTARFGIEGTAGLITVVYIFPLLPLDAYLLVRTIGGSYRRLVREVAYPLVASVSMYAVTVAVDRQVAVASGVLEFGLLVFVGIAVYAALTTLFALQFNWGIEENVRSLLDAAA